MSKKRGKWLKRLMSSSCNSIDLKPSGSPLVEREVLAAQEVALVRQAISELKPKYQRAFILHKFRDWSIADIAVDMGMTPRMVRSYIARSVCYCRLRLDGEHAEAAFDTVKELMP
jgi:DNA-directed RNA polymerase specialized sigma24 family protein